MHASTCDASQRERKHLTNCRQHREMSVHRTEQHPILSAQEKWRKLLKHKEQTCTAPLPVVCEGGGGRTKCTSPPHEGKNTHRGRPGGRTTGHGGGAGLYEELLMPQRWERVEVPQWVDRWNWKPSMTRKTLLKLYFLLLLLPIIIIIIIYQKNDFS